MTISFRDASGLAETLRSVRRQDHPSIQHIVIDGGSGPAVTEMLAGSDHLHHWQSQPDGGRYDAMNIGIAHATGDIVWFLHSGDIFHSTASVSAVVARIHGLPKPFWGYGKADLVDADRRVIGAMGQPDFDLRRFALGGWAIPHQAAFFDHDLLSTIGPYDLEHGLAADQELMLRAAMVTSPIFIDETLCDFDTTGAGSTRGVHPHFADMRRAATTNLRLRGRRRSTYLLRSALVEARAYGAYSTMTIARWRRDR